MQDFLERLDVYRQCVEHELDRCLPQVATEPKKLHEAMRYSVLGNGKRIRPILVYAAGEAFGLDINILHAPACAVEIIHAYSLIHDDLPSMDNDDLRRGRPTCHKVYNEATAILAGDALQTLAFHVLAHCSDNAISDSQRLKMINTLAVASGSMGMAGGQMIDLEAVGKSLNIAELKNMHSYKTGVLFQASVELGVLAADGVETETFDRMSMYAKHIGLAFQVTDDILDIESDTETLGKTQGADITMNKPTYPDLLGLDGAKKVAQDLYEDAIACLDVFDNNANMLRDIAKYIVNRKK